MPRWRRTAVVPLVVPLAVALGISGCGTTAKPANTKTKPAPVKVTFVEPAPVPSVSGAGIIAQKQGYFADEGIQASFIRGGGGANVQMLLGSGTAQFGVMGSAEIPHVNKQPGKPLAVLPIQVGTRYQLVVRSEIAKARGISPHLPPKEILAKLKGLSIAGSSAEAEATLAVDYALQRYGFNPKGYLKWVYVGDPNARTSAFLTGAADLVSLVNYSDSARVLSSGKAVVALKFATLPAFAKLYNLVLVTTTKMAQTQPGTVRKVVAAYTRALDFLYRHPKSSVKVLEAFYKGKLPPQAVAGTYKQDIVPSLPRTAQPSLGYRMTETEWRAVDRMDVATHVIAKPTNPREGVMWTNKFMPAPAAS